MLAGEEVDGVQHLDGVAGGGGERLVHVGDQRTGLRPAPLATATRLSASVAGILAASA